MHSFGLDDSVVQKTNLWDLVGQSRQYVLRIWSVTQSERNERESLSKRKGKKGEEIQNWIEQKVIYAHVSNQLIGLLQSTIYDSIMSWCFSFFCCWDTVQQWPQYLCGHSTLPLKLRDENSSWFPTWKPMCSAVTCLNLWSVNLLVAFLVVWLFLRSCKPYTREETEFPYPWFQNCTLFFACCITSKLYRWQWSESCCLTSCGQSSCLLWLRANFSEHQWAPSFIFWSLFESLRP